MKLYIKNMVSYRCVLLVIEKLDRLGLSHTAVTLGVVELPETLTAVQWEDLNEALVGSGLELIEDKKEILIEQIKCVIIDVIHHSVVPLKVNFSVYLASQLDYSYTYLTHIFSVSEGCTIERFMMKHRIERAKELLLYDELTLTEIAFELNYSSVAHLAFQFKKITGMTSSAYKKSVSHVRGRLEDI